MKRLIASVLAAAAIVVAAGCGGQTTTTTTTGLSSVEVQKQVCPPEQGFGQYEQGGLAKEPEVSPECIAALNADQIEGAYAAPSPDLLGARGPPTLGPLGAYANGQFPASAISPATGCTIGLANSAAAAWNHVAVVVHEHTGYWLQSNGSVSCYRTYSQQVDLRNQWCAQGACQNAAVPGTSNHGWGIAVDAPSTTVSMIHRYAGGLFGQGYGSCSDAPWEGWHIKYCGGYSGPNPGAYGSGGGGGGGHVFHTLRLGKKGPRVSKLSTHLALLQNLNDRAPHYLAWAKRSKVYTRSVKHGVRRLQHDGKLGTDGIYGPKTAGYQANRWHHFCKVHQPKPKACK